MNEWGHYGRKQRASFFVFFFFLATTSLEMDMCSREFIKMGFQGLKLEASKISIHFINHEYKLISFEKFVRPPRSTDPISDDT